MAKKSASNSRVLYPATGFTVADLVSYYRKIARVLLPHLAGRPVSLKRYPDNIHGESFWEKDLPAFAPSWVKTFAVPRVNERSDIHYIDIADIRTLTWAAAMGCIEIHPFLHKYPLLDRPTMLVFDLDPGQGVDIVHCCQVALMLREFFAREEMQCFPKVSGSKGMQVYVPLNVATGYNITQPFARKVADFLCETAPQLILSDMAKRNRQGKVFIDWSQNAPHKTTIGVYSVRAKRDKPYVSLPINWEEIQGAVRSRERGGLDFDTVSALERVKELGDLFAPVLTLRQQLPEQLLHEWNIATRPLRARARAKKLATKNVAALPRSSGQGGRRVFVIHRMRWSRWQYELGVAEDDKLLCWDLGDALPLKAGAEVAAKQSHEERLGYLTFQTGNSTVWDLGTYEVAEGSLRSGQVKLFLSGRKLHGEWTLTRPDQHEEQTWRLTNTGGTLRLGGLKLDESALTAAAPGRRAGVPAQPKTPAVTLRPVESSTLPKHAAAFVKPMECSEVNAARLLPPDTSQWLYEMKWDGFRCIAVKRDGRVEMLTRRGNVPNARFEHITEALMDSALSDVVLDGELVALNTKGTPEFQLLQNSKRNDAPVVYAVFDIINCAGRDLTSMPLEKRKQFLASLRPVLPAQHVVISEPLNGEVQQIVELMRAEGLEGVVAKRRTSLYYPGRDKFEGWIKYRITEVGEFVIGGYMPRNDPYFDALVVGRPEDGKLIYKEKIRFGFEGVDKSAILKLLEPLRIPKCPFANLPQKKRRGALDAAQMRQCVWVKPEIWCEMEFPEWTDTGEIRGHGKFRQLLDGQRRKTV
jgi:bifunctional non-homologous end joining protein LigD